MLGIVAEERGGGSTVWLVALVVLLLVALLVRKWPFVQSVAICLCFGGLGGLLASFERQSFDIVWPDAEVHYEAVVLSDPVEKPKTMAVDIQLTGGQLTNLQGRKLKCYLQKDGRSRALRVGDGLRLRSRIRENSHWRFGTFDYHRYLEVHGFSGSTYVSGLNWQRASVSLRGLSRLQRTRLHFLSLRSRLLQRFVAQDMGADQYAVVAAMVLGDKSALSSDLKDVYSQTGASHVLALSGLHLGIIYTLLSLLVVGRRWRMLSQLLIILSIWAFVFLVGLSVSVVRSAIMLTVYGLLSLGHRDKMSVNALAFTAIVLLVANPFALFDVGFQMSFLAVLAILLFHPLFERVVSQEFLQSHRLVCWGWSLACVSCAAQIGVAPLVAYYFGRFSTYFLLTNFIVVPAATLILYLSLTTLLVPALAYLLIYIVGLLNTVLLHIALLPGASIEGLHPSALQVLLTYVVIFALYLLVVKLASLTYSLASAGYRSGSPQP